MTTILAGPRAGFTLVSLLLLAQADFVPATLVSADVPEQPAQAVGGGEVLLELSVSAAGAVEGTTVVRATPPFTDLVTGIVSGWQFAPAETVDADGARGPTASKVLVVALFRPPTLTPAPGRGSAVQEVSVASPELPYPLTLTPPMFPPGAMFQGVALLALAVTDAGAVSDVSVVQSAAVFDQAAIDAVRQWRFQPATRDGRPVSSTVVALLGFRQPLTLE